MRICDILIEIVVSFYEKLLSLLLETSDYSLFNNLYYYEKTEIYRARSGGNAHLCSDRCGSGEATGIEVAVGSW